MDDCGLRVEETLYISPRDISRKNDRATKSKCQRENTRRASTTGKHRETWMAAEHERLVCHADDRGIEDLGSVISRTKRTVQTWVENATEQAAEETGDLDYLRVSSLDLR